MELIKIEEVGGKLVTTSKNIADVFEKTHPHVNRKIEKLEMSNDFRTANFRRTEIIDGNGDKQKGYLLTRDGWSMIVMSFTGEKSVKWKEDYIWLFNKMEDEIRIKLPQNYKEALIALVAEVGKTEILEIELKDAQPKIEFHDQVGNSEGLYSIGEVAKTLNLGFGRNKFFDKLREKKIFFNREPYQRYIDQGLFQVKTTTNNEHIQKQSFVTPKGFQWLQKQFQ